MTLHPPYSPTSDKQLLLEALAARDARLQELEAIIARQSEVISELQRSLGLNSRNSSKPPSSDGLGKPPASRRDNLKGRKPGGQKGHEGKTLLRSETPGHVEHHYPRGCVHCGHTLDEGMSVRIETRQVRDIPDPSPLIVTDHIAHVRTCPHCKLETKAPFPKGVEAPVQYGPNLTAFVAYINKAQLIPMNRLAQTLLDLFGVKLSQGTIVNMVSRTAARQLDVLGWIRNMVVDAPVKHMDETGVRIGGKLHWLHVSGTRDMACFWIGKSRGDVMLDARGIAIHDCWKSYDAIEGVTHGHCNAHLLRELNELIEFRGESWANDLLELIARAIREYNRAGGNPLSPGIIGDIFGNYDRLVAEGFRYHESQEPLPSAGKRGRKKRRRGHNLLIRLKERRDAYLLFVQNPQVPPTNNMAEQYLRFAKVEQKISGCHRSMEGAINGTIIRSVLATARKRGWNLLDTLRSSPGELMERLGAGPLVDTEPIT